MDSRSISHYRILKKLGEGGMGEVYLAQDTHLDRRVALKILPEAFAGDPERMRRFVQEAKAASALNHPNILTIHEIGEADGKHYIATEFIEGETLRRHIERSRLKMREVLEVAVQVASALSAAHQAGIIHRDIKPENIMLRPDGYAKVLDFGLAKLSEKRTFTTDSDAATISRKATDPGTVMGTVAYMSPEQARGKEVDPRTDVFSLGILLYEMIAGRAPFAGESSTDVLAAILDKEPPPLLRYADETPQELQRIVTKCLRKERDERYQTVKDLLLDLKELRDELALEAKLERSIRPATSNIDNQRTLIAEGVITGEAAPQTGAARAQTTSSAEYLVSEINQHRRGIAVSLLVVLLAALGLGYWYFFNRDTSNIQIESIAVMPFVNETGNADNEYLSDGMTESLIGSLSQLPNLSVKARSSVFRYKGKETSSQTVGKELSVQAVLLGRIVQRGETLTLNLELVDTQTENVIWSEQYNRKLTDMVALQSEVARDVSQKLRERLSGAEQQRTAKSYTQNPEAYELYLKGLYHWNKRTPDDLNQALLLFQQAIEKDPTYAKAYAGLALTYSVLAGPNTNTGMTTEQEREARLKASSAARKALELDNTLAEAYAVLGSEKVQEWDFTGAESDLKRAVELDPNYATARQWYSQLLARFGRHDEAIAEIKKAYELDPFSPAINVNFGNRYLQAGRDDEAIAQYQKFIETEPNVGFAYYFLAYAYARKEMFEEALNVWCKRDVLLKVQTPESCEKEKIEFREAIKKEGATGFWRKRLEETLDDYEKGTVFPSAVAAGYAMINDKERAFEWLEKAFAERDPDLSWLKTERSFDNIKSDPRFQDLLRRVGLPQ